MDNDYGIPISLSSSSDDDIKLSPQNTTTVITPQQSDSSSITGTTTPNSIQDTPSSSIDSLELETIQDHQYQQNHSNNNQPQQQSPIFSSKHVISLFEPDGGYSPSSSPSPPASIILPTVSEKNDTTEFISNNNNDIDTVYNNNNNNNNNNNTDNNDNQIPNIENSFETPIEDTQMHTIGVNDDEYNNNNTNNIADNDDIYKYNDDMMTSQISHDSFQNSILSFAESSYLDNNHNTQTNDYYNNNNNNNNNFYSQQNTYNPYQQQQQYYQQQHQQQQQNLSQYKKTHAQQQERQQQSQIFSSSHLTNGSQLSSNDASYVQINPNVLSYSNIGQSTPYNDDNNTQQILFQSQMDRNLQSNHFGVMNAINTEGKGHIEHNEHDNNDSDDNRNNNDDKMLESSIYDDSFTQSIAITQATTNNNNNNANTNTNNINKINFNNTAYLNAPEKYSDHHKLSKIASVEPNNTSLDAQIVEIPASNITIPYLSSTDNTSRGNISPIVTSSSDNSDSMDTNDSIDTKTNNELLSINVQTLSPSSHPVLDKHLSTDVINQQYIMTTVSDDDNQHIIQSPTQSAKTTQIPTQNDQNNGSITSDTMPLYSMQITTSDTQDTQHQQHHHQQQQQQQQQQLRHVPYSSNSLLLDQIHPYDDHNHHLHRHSYDNEELYTNNANNNGDALTTNESNSQNIKHTPISNLFMSGIDQTSHTQQIIVNTPQNGLSHQVDYDSNVDVHESSRLKRSVSTDNATPSSQQQHQQQQQHSTFDSPGKKFVFKPKTDSSSSSSQRLSIPSSTDSTKKPQHQYIIVDRNGAINDAKQQQARQSLSTRSSAPAPITSLSEDYELLENWEKTDNFPSSPDGSPVRHTKQQLPSPQQQHLNDSNYLSSSTISQYHTSPLSALPSSYKNGYDDGSHNQNDINDVPVISLHRDNLSHENEMLLSSISHHQRAETVTTSPLTQPIKNDLSPKNIYDIEVGSVQSLSLSSGSHNTTNNDNNNNNNDNDNDNNDNDKENNDDNKKSDKDKKNKNDNNNTNDDNADDVNNNKDKNNSNEHKNINNEDDITWTESIRQFITPAFVAVSAAIVLFSWYNTSKKKSDRRRHHEFGDTSRFNNNQDDFDANEYYANDYVDDDDTYYQE